MSSERRITSSRANGALSKGPVTAGGKRRSSKNSLKHGMLAASVVLDGESTPRFIKLIKDLERQYQPSNPTEKAMVEHLAVTQWRMERIVSIEKATWTDGIAQQSDDVDTPTRYSRALRSLSEKSPIIDLLARYEVRLSRQCARYEKVLRKRKIPNCQTNLVPFPDSELQDE